MRAWALVLAIAGLVAGAAAARPVDGELLASQPCPPRAQTYDEYVAAMVKAEREEAELAAQAGVPAPSAADLPDVLITRDEYDAELKAPPRCEQISYGSDGLRVAGLVWKPADAKPGANLPAIVMLRGGNRDFGKFRPDSQRRMHALVSAGFVVVGVQYRGVDGGEGLEQFGGDDVRDVLNAIKLARGLPEVDARNVFLHGGSRGGMMVYLALRDGADVNAAVVLNGVADLSMEAQRRPDVAEGVWRQLMPDYDARRDDLLRARSGVHIVEVVDMPPILLLHGTADWRAHPDNSIEVARRLQARGRPYALHLFKDDVHGLTWNWRERDRLVIDWFRRHMRP